MKNPNIIVFCTDQQPASWLGCAGHPHVKTPNIDAIAKEGVRFSNAYCNTPVCMASRAAMFTGLPGSVTGCRTNGIPLNHQYPTLPQILKDNGYQTFATGKLHLTSWAIRGGGNPDAPPLKVEDHPEARCFWASGQRTHIEDGYFGLDWVDFIGGHGAGCYGDYTNWLKTEHPDQYEKFAKRETAKPSLDYDDPQLGTHYSTMDDQYSYNHWIKDRTIEKIDRVAEDQPFFGWVSYPDPHFPFGPSEPYSSMYDPEKIDPPIAWDDDKGTMPEFYHKEWCAAQGLPPNATADTNRTYDQLMESKALSYGMTTAVDHSIGEIVAHLKDTNRYEDTIFVFLSDHGDSRGDHKMLDKGPFHYDTILHVPFVVSYPKKLQKGVVSESFAQLLDVMPTLLDLAEVDYPKPAIPDFAGAPTKLPPTYGTSSLSRLAGNSLVPVLTGEVEQVQDYVLIEDEDEDYNLVLRTLITSDYKMTFFMGREDGVLFDRIKDPEERCNQWNNPHYATAKGDMMVKLNHAILKTTNRNRRRISMA